jgi:hypothetical protein
MAGDLGRLAIGVLLFFLMLLWLDMRRNRGFFLSIEVFRARDYSLALFLSCIIVGAFTDETTGAS